MKKIPEIMLVRWMDAMTHHTWKSTGTEYDLLECCSVGFLVEQTGDKIVLAQSTAMDEDAKPWADVVVIPRAVIKTMESVRSAEEENHDHHP